MSRLALMGSTRSLLPRRGVNHDARELSLVLRGAGLLGLLTWVFIVHSILIYLGYLLLI